MKNLFKKETESDRIRAEIQKTEFKKNSMISAVLGERQILEQQKTGNFIQIGELVYAKDKDDEKECDFQPYIDAITKLEKEILMKNEKIDDISKRYDEEINLLSVNLATVEAAELAASQMYQSPVASPAAPQGFCENCGKGFLGGDMFCQGCGNKLS